MERLVAKLYVRLTQYIDVSQKKLPYIVLIMIRWYNRFDRTDIRNVPAKAERQAIMAEEKKRSMSSAGRRVITQCVNQDRSEQAQ